MITLNALDIKNINTWPTGVKIIAMILIVAFIWLCAYTLIIADQLDRLSAAHQQVRLLQRQLHTPIPSSAFKMVGMLQQDHKNWVLIAMPDGMIHWVPQQQWVKYSK